MKIFKLLLVCLAFFYTQSAFSQELELTPEQEQYLNEIKQLWDSLNPQSGQIDLQNGVAKLNVPDNFIYFNSADSKKILVDLWGNPPGAGTDTLGMLLPSNIPPFDENSWGVTIEYVEEGYISDDDAEEIDYEELLSQMKDDAAEASKQRVKNGYESFELIGWASKPYYDKSTHKLHWAKEIKFGDNEINTLNYNIRVLGRKGYLVLNFIAQIDQKQLIDSQLKDVLAIAEFKRGYSYSEFNPSIDKMAGYGLGALVAGKLITKTGFLTAAFVFLKKFGVIIIAAIGGLMAKFFRRKKE